MIMDVVENGLQSEKNLDVLTFKLGVASMVRNGAKLSLITNAHEARLSKRPIISINNNDNTCLSRTIAV